MVAYCFQLYDLPFLCRSYFLLLILQQINFNFCMFPINLINLNLNTFFSFFVLTRVTHMNCDVVRRRYGPLKIETKSNVVIICGKFPKYESSFFVCRHSNSNRLARANFNYGIVILKILKLTKNKKVIITSPSKHVKVLILL